MSRCRARVLDDALATLRLSGDRRVPADAPPTYRAAVQIGRKGRTRRVDPPAHPALVDRARCDCGELGGPELSGAGAAAAEEAAARVGESSGARAATASARVPLTTCGSDQRGQANAAVG